MESERTTECERTIESERNASEVGPDAMTLSKTFDESIKLFKALENTTQASNTLGYQTMVTKTVDYLESATHMVNHLHMFSANETIEEVATSDLKYLLLPALLGYLSTQKLGPDPKKRLRQLELSEIYYKDFLKRCKNYELPNVEIPDISEDEEEKEEEETSSDSSKQSDLASMSALRDEKVRLYKVVKDVENELGELETAMKLDDSDETKRNYYLLLLKKWVIKALQESSSNKAEKILLKNMFTIKPDENEKDKKQSLKPVIIVRSELQKQVFGLGYPSIPLMTVNEFYQQRYPDSQSSNNHAMNSLQQMAVDPEVTKEKIEMENAEEESLIEKDDPETLEKARAFDDWKDENRRGCGNRENKG